jgi:hypothetical protein
MRKMAIYSAMMILLCGLSLVHAQEKEPTPDQTKAAGQESKTKSDRTNAVVTPYRLDFSLYELEDGKKINTRHVSLDLTAGSGNDIKIGTRVPVPTGKNTPDPSFNFQYMDVGTRIWANLGIMGSGDLRLDVRSEVSNVEMSADHTPSSGTPPIVRQIQINGTTLLVTGTPILIGSIDDPNSNRQFQLEVTVTKLR